MDQASYQRHLNPKEEPAREPEPSAPDLPHNDPFAVSQDLRAIAAQAFDADRAAIQPQATTAPAVEYRPGTIRYVPYTDPVTGEIQQRFLVVGETVLPRGSGSYRTSGSYVLTSGSYRLTSGSYWITSGSFLVRHTSYSSFAVQPPYGSNQTLLGGYGLHLI